MLDSKDNQEDNMREIDAETPVVWPAFCYNLSGNKLKC